MSSIPTATYVIESTVVPAPLASVWHLIKLGSFDKFWSRLEKSSVDAKASDDTEVFLWNFKDGTELTVKQEEHSSIEHSITYSVISSNPGLTYTSVVSKISLFPITTGESEGATYVQWSGNFSSDADAGVIADARFKRKEALADLAKAVKA